MLGFRARPRPAPRARRPGPTKRGNRGGVPGKTQKKSQGDGHHIGQDTKANRLAENFKERLEKHAQAVLKEGAVKTNKSIFILTLQCSNF